jgi:type VI secretion system VasD/TssJ family lipoprotein
MRTTSLTRAFVIAFATLSLVSCVSVSSKPKVAAVKMSVSAAADVNPAGDGRPSSLVLRIYQLKSDTKFLAADFFGLYDKEDEVLAGDLLASQELTLAPGESRELEMEISAEAAVARGAGCAPQGAQEPDQERRRHHRGAARRGDADHPRIASADPGSATNTCR